METTMASNRSTAINAQSITGEIHVKNCAKSEGEGGTNDSWEVVGTSKNKRTTTSVVASGGVQQKPPLRRQYSKNVRRVQSGEVVSLQQQQQQQNQSKQQQQGNNQKQKLPIRSQSFMLPPQPSSIVHSHGNNSNRRSSYGSQNSDRSIMQNKSENTITTTTGKKKNQPSRSKSNNALQQPHKSKSLDEVVLFNTTGSGMTMKEMKVVRVSADLLLSQRMKYTDAPLIWTPHNRCHWQVPDRIRKIEQEHSLFYHYTPLQVNNETRWKPKVIIEATGKPALFNEDQLAVKIARITSILNKLSWTNLNKLTGKFIEELGTSTNVDSTSNSTGNESQRKDSGTFIAPELIGKAMKIVVEKAILEPHFAELYAQFSAKLAKIHKQFKKCVQNLCEQQFTLITSDNETTPGKDIQQQSIVESKKNDVVEAKKKSIGLMKFIGELYLMDIFKTSIMVSCCEQLLCPTDEEKLESFCKLMSTIGKKLQDEQDQNNEQLLLKLWDNVYCMAGKAPPGMSDYPVAPSTRIKFFLQSLIELKENNWMQVRHEHEKAQTIEQIHAQAADEARHGPIVQTTSSILLLRSKSNDQLLFNDGIEETRPVNKLRRAKSEMGNGMLSGKKTIETTASNGISSKSSDEQRSSGFLTSNLVISTKGTTKNLNMAQCSEKTKVILKEFFVSGDRDEAVLSLDEIIDINSSGHLKRGKAVVTAGILLVLEMKEVHVRKFLDVVSKLLDDQAIATTCLTQALMDPLDYLSDIEIDAPQAPKLLAIIVADWLTKKVDDGETAISSLEFLLNSPKNFRRENPAMVAAHIIKARGNGVTDTDAQVIQSLMTKHDFESYSTVEAFIAANC